MTPGGLRHPPHQACAEGDRVERPVQDRGGGHERRGDRDFCRPSRAHRRAPHPRHGKETACGCAGCYTAHAALELYAEAFDAVGALDRLEAFASFHGPDFYGLPRNTTTVTLRRQPTLVPNGFPFGADELIPLRAGETLGWRLV